MESFKFMGPAPPFFPPKNVTISHFLFVEIFFSKMLVVVLIKSWLVYLLQSEACLRFSLIYSRVLSPRGRIKHWQYKRRQQNNSDNKTFTFFQEVSSLSTRSAKNWSRQGPTTPELPSEWKRGFLIENKTSDQKFSPNTPALLQPPPGSSCQVIHLLSAPQLACWIKFHQRWR